jgi:DNA-binding GntR family transcriptional regulator
VTAIVDGSDEQDAGDGARLPSSLIGDTHRALTDLLRESLKHQIVMGVRQPGDRLIEKDLAEEFGVSRNPAREALRHLSAEGFVSLLPRRGAIVAEVSPDEAESLFEVRVALETAAAGAASRRRAQGYEDRLLALIDASSQALAADDMDRVSEINRHFHEAVAEASGNRYLVELLRPLRWKVQRLFVQSVGTRAPHSHDEHQLLVTAILDGSEEEARSLAAYHVRRARDAYRAVSGEAISLGTTPTG